MTGAPSGGDTPSTAIHLASAALASFAGEHGGWAAPLSTPAPIDAITVLCQLPAPPPGALSEAAQSILARLEADGRYPAFPGGPADSGACVLAYTLLKLSGLSSSAEPMEHLRTHVLSLGGLQAVDPYTRLLLAIFGLYPGEHLPPLPPRNQWPQLPAWARAQLAPLSHLYNSHIATGLPRPAPRDLSITELIRSDLPFSDPKPASPPGLQSLFRRVSGWLSAPAQDPAPPPLPDHTATLAPTPGLWLTRLAAGQPLPSRCVPAALPVRDTALALLAHPRPSPESAAWLRRQCLPGAAWPRQFAAELHPHTEETALSLLALHRAAPSQEIPAEPLQWLRRQQNRHGGWAACEPNLHRPASPPLPFPGPFADADPACPALTGLALEALAASGATPEDPAVQRGVQFLLDAQLMRDGSWPSRWGIHFLHGTCFALRGLRAAGFDDHDAVVLRAGEWLRSCQNADGGWGESPASLDAGEFVEAPSNPIQTAWALLGLLAGGDPASESVRRGRDFLLASQTPDGAWLSPAPTLLHVPPVLLLANPLDALVFPILALQALREANS